MAANIGPKIGIDGEAEYRKQLEQIIAKNKALAAELKATVSAFDRNASAQDKARASGDVLARQVENQRRAVEQYREMVERSAATKGEDATETQKWTAVLHNAEAELNRLENELDEANEAAEGLTDATEDLGDAEEETAEKTSRLGSIFQSAFGVLGRAAIAGVTAAAAGLAALTKQSVEQYAEYEQLVGGVETLFGSSAATVQNYANSAFSSAGMDANAYMETVTSFSASLLQGLGGDAAAAAELANTAIIDMADNANKMGSDMESVQAAYQGFAKGQYQLLDNLKLGYGGTKTEMERLLQDAEAISGVHYDIENYSDVISAIHTIQDEMGIAGATADEAASTISGSVAAMGSAWSNLVTGMADDNADMEALIGNVVSAAETAAANVLPRVEIALSGIGQLVSGMAPLISSMIPTLLADVLPELLDAGAELLTGLLDGINAAAPQLASGAATIVAQLAGFLVSNLPTILSTGMQMIPALIGGLAAALPDLIGYLPEIVVTITEVILDNLPLIIATGVQALVALIQGLGQALPQLISYTPTIIANLVKTLLAGLGSLRGAGSQLLQAVIRGLRSIISSVANVGLDIVRGIWNGISSGLGWIKSRISGWVGDVLSFIKRLFKISSPSGVMRDEVGRFLALGIGEGFADEMGTVKDMVQGSMQDLSTYTQIPVGVAFSGAGTAYPSQSYTAGGAFGGVQIGTVEITIEGAGKNAEEIGWELQSMFERRVAAFR